MQRQSTDKIKPTASATIGNAGRNKEMFVIYFLLVVVLSCVCVSEGNRFPPGFVPLFLEKRQPSATNDSSMEDQHRNQQAAIRNKITEVQNSFRLLDTRPTRECINSFGPDVQLFYCPTPQPDNPLEWTCVRELQFCNGIPDCPYGEDEDPTMCMFHLAYRSEISQLKQLIINLMVDREESENTDADSSRSAEP